MHSESENIQTMISDITDEIIEKCFNSLKKRNENNLQSIRSSEFVLDYVHLLYYKCNEIKLTRWIFVLNCGGSYIDSPDWIKNKQAIINPINKKNSKCFQQATIVVLNYEEIKTDPQRITKIKPFITKYNWEGINYPSE